MKIRVFLISLTASCLLSACSASNFTSSMKKFTLPPGSDQVKVRIDRVAVKSLDGDEITAIASYKLGQRAAELSPEELMTEAMKTYPEIFSDDESALPLELTVKTRINDGTSTALLLEVSSFAILGAVFPLPIWDTEDFELSVRIDDPYQGTLFDQKIEFTQKHDMWYSMLTPLALIPYPGEADVKISYFGDAAGDQASAAMTRTSVLAATAKALLQVDRQKLLTAYQTRLRLDAGLLAVSQAQGRTAPARSTKALRSFPTSNFDLQTLPQGRTNNRDGVAVIIGNADYQSHNEEVPDSPYSHNDADAIQAYLTRTLGFQDRNIILLKDAGQAELVSVFGNPENPNGKLHDYVRPHRSDVFVFYSGHGAPALGDGKGFLLPVDGDPSKVELNGYALETLYANLSKLPARSVSILLDSSFSGSSSGGPIIQNASSIALNLKETKADIENSVILKASKPEEVASWDDETKMGLFTRIFLEGVSGMADEGTYGNKDGVVLASELKKFLEDEVRYVARREYRRDQNPQVTGDGNQAF